MMIWEIGYGYRLTALPKYAKNKNNLSDNWLVWTTKNGSEQTPNLLTFADSSVGSVFGFDGAPTLTELQKGEINWATKYPTQYGSNQSYSASINYGPKTVKAISISADLEDDSAQVQFFDDIYLKLTNGKEVRINLESGVAETFWVDDDENAGTLRYMALPNLSYTGTLGEIYDKLSGFFGSEEMPPANFNDLKSLIGLLNTNLSWTIPVPADEDSVITIGIMDFVHDEDTVYVSSGTYKADIETDKKVNLIGIADEEGQKPVIEGTGAANDGTNSVNVKLLSGSSGSKIQGLEFQANKGDQVSEWSSNNTYYSIMLKADSSTNPIKDVVIKDCTFDTDITEPLQYHAVAIQDEVSSKSTLIENCTFTGGYYVTVQGKYNTNDLTIKTSTITSAKSGINIWGGSNIVIDHVYIQVKAQAPQNDTYAVRVGIGAAMTNTKITAGTFIVDKSGIEPGEGIYHSAIIIETHSSGDLEVKGARIQGEVINLSTATLYASGNYWGSDKGPFGAKLAGPIVIYDWYADEGMAHLVSLDSVAQKVPAPGSTGVSPNAEVKIVFPSEVQMDTTKEIAITTNGSKLSGVSATLQGDGKTVVVTHPPFAYGTQYTVNVPGGTFKATLGEDANVQVLAEQPTSWSFTTAARPLPPPPPPPEEPTPPGAEEPLPDSAIEEAISEAEETGEVVLSAPEGEDTLALTLDQLAIIGETEKPVVVNIGEVQMELPAAVVSNLAELTGAQVEIKVAELSSTAAEELHGQATNADQYKLAGTIFEITMELVKSDGSREDITDLGGKVKVYVPVPSDKQELAAAGLLTVARFNENTEACEEIPSSFDEDTKCMIFETTHFSKYAVLEKVLDTAAPTVVNTDPVDNATNVPIDKVIKVTFNEDVVSATNFDKITLADAKGATVAVTTTLTASVLTITPSDPLAYSTEYTVTIPAGAVKDAADNTLPEDFSFNFTTMAEPDTTAPEVESTDPANGAVDVPLDKVIKVIFNEDIVEGDAFADIVLKNAEGKEISTKVEISGSDLTIKPDAPLGFSTKYTVTIPAGAVKDVAGNPLKEAYTFSFTTVGLPTQTFDDIQGHWAQHDIELMAGLGIAKGVGDNKFNPDGSVTRAEFVALLVRSLDVPVEPVSETSFKDVPPDAWFAAEVEAAHKVGIAIGFEDGTFRPYAQVTREQIAAFIVRAMNWTVEEEEVDALLSRFTDQAKISSWAKKEVAAAVQKGIVLGRPDGTFDPQANATRAEAVVMLKRVLQAAGVIPPNV